MNGHWISNSLYYCLLLEYDRNAIYDEERCGIYIQISCVFNLVLRSVQLRQAGMLFYVLVHSCPFL